MYEHYRRRNSENTILKFLQDCPQKFVTTDKLITSGDTLHNFYNVSYQEVYRQIDVLHQFISSHAYVPNGCSKAKHFLHLEFDRTLRFADLK